MRSGQIKKVDFNLSFIENAFLSQKQISNSENLVEVSIEVLDFRNLRTRLTHISFAGRPLTCVPFTRIRKLNPPNSKTCYTIQFLVLYLICATKLL